VLAEGSFNIMRLGLFFMGAVLMRGAGCIINDIVDRDIDKHVERTKNRPLATGELSVKKALALLYLLLWFSLMIAMKLGAAVIMWGALALIPVACYPFMKRISWWPQLFLGLVFNWGALMGWACVRGQIELPAVLLYIAGICWTLGYDTIYAIQDKADDIKIGVRSTALRLGGKLKAFVAVMYGFFIGLAALAAGSLHGAVLLIPAAIHCIWQVKKLDINDPKSGKTLFFSNVWLGLLVFLALFFSVL
jgi:4-hydroxybenzoate polyprenyltransferase